MFGDGKINRYLRKLGYRGSAQASFDTLQELQSLHLQRIPYENLDILNGRLLSLEPDDLYDKIILKQRGGYCFELNGLYRELLISLGYRVSQYAGRYLTTPGLGQLRKHRVLVVDIDGTRFITDVGYRSEQPRCPLELKADKIQTDGISEYKLRVDPFYGWVIMQKEAGKDWRDLYAFTEEPQLDMDFILPSFYCERHPTSPFIDTLKLSVFTSDSNVCLVDDRYYVYQNASIVETRTVSDDEARGLLLQKFYIDVPKDYTRILVHHTDKRDQGTPE